MNSGILIQLLSEISIKQIEKYWGKLETERQIKDILIKANEIFSKECQDQNINALNKDYPIHDLPSLREAVLKLPIQVSDSELQATLRKVIERDWKLTSEEADKASRLYLKCLRIALSHVPTFTPFLTIEGVLRLEEKLDHIEELQQESLDVQKNKFIHLSSMNHVEEEEKKMSIDLGNIQAKNEFFTNRHAELNKLQEWIVLDRCRGIILSGIGGVGKTACALKLIDELKPEFDYIFGRELQSSFRAIGYIEQAIKFFSDHEQTDLSRLSWNEKIQRLLELLEHKRCLMVLDNYEYLLETDLKTKYNWGELVLYNDLIENVGGCEHKSCMVVTSRELWDEIQQSEGISSAIHILEIGGVDVASAKEILKNKDVDLSDTNLYELVQHFGGHPLCIMSLARLLKGTPEGLRVLDEQTSELLNLSCFRGVRDVMEWHFNHLSDIQRSVMIWMAIEREPVQIENVGENYLIPISPLKLINAIEELHNKYSLLQRSGSYYRLQNVMLEYVTGQIAEKIAGELKTREFDWFQKFALLKAHTKDYIRVSQIHQIIDRILEKLESEIGESGILTLLLKALERIKSEPTLYSSYAAGNLLNLMVELMKNLHDYDFSGLTIRQAFLSNSRLIRMNFRNCTFEHCMFAETFGWIVSLAFHPSGDVLAIGDNSGVIKVWDFKNDRLLWACSGHDVQWVNQVLFTPDGNYLVSGGEDKKIKLWEVETGTLQAEFNGFDSELYALAIHPNGEWLAAGFANGKLLLLNLNTKTIENRRWKLNGVIYGLSFHPDGQWLASGGEGSFHLYNLENGHCIEIDPSVHSNGIASLVYSQDGKYLASGDHKDTIIIWNADTFQKIIEIKGQKSGNPAGHKSFIYSLDFSPDGNYLASGSLDRSIKIWDTEDWNCKRTLQGYSDAVHTVRFHPKDSDLVAGSGYDQTIRLWEVESGNSRKVVRGYKGNVTKITLSPDNQLLASSSNDHSIRVFDLESKKEMLFLEEHESYVPYVAFSPDGKYLASCSTCGTIVVNRVRTGERVVLFTNKSGAGFNCVRYTPSGDALVSGDDDGNIIFWNLELEMPQKRYKNHSSVIYSLDFIPEKNWLVSVGDDKAIRVWDFEREKMVFQWERGKSALFAIGCSPDGNYVAIAGYDPFIYIWNTTSWKRVHKLEGHEICTMALTFSPDGKWLSSCGGDSLIYIWNFETGQRVGVLKGHEDWVETLAFARDSKTLYSGSDDETIRIWDIQKQSVLEKLVPERIYERTDITGVKGLSQAQIKTLVSKFGAIDREVE